MQGLPNGFKWAGAEAMDVTPQTSEQVKNYIDTSVQ